MMVAAHQPLYLPWVGFFDKLARCDVFVLMDDLQHVMRNFQHRNRIKVNNGTKWLTVPLIRGARDERICDKLIANDCTNPRHHWQRRTWLTLTTHYGRTPHFERYAGDLERVYSGQWRTLLELDLHLLQLFMRWLQIDTPLIMASSLGLSGQKTDRIVDMCRRVGASAYFTGSGGSRDYLEVNKLDAAGITVHWQKYEHPVYPQRYPSLGFIPYLSAIDLLCNCGPESPAVLRRGAVLSA